MAMQSPRKRWGFPCAGSNPVSSALSLLNDLKWKKQKKSFRPEA